MTGLKGHQTLATHHLFVAGSFPQVPHSGRRNGRVSWRGARVTMAEAALVGLCQLRMPMPRLVRMSRSVVGAWATVQVQMQGRSGRADRGEAGCGAASCWLVARQRLAAKGDSRQTEKHSNARYHGKQLDCTSSVGWRGLPCRLVHLMLGVGPRLPKTQHRHPAPQTNKGRLQVTVDSIHMEEERHLRLSLPMPACAAIDPSTSAAHFASSASLPSQAEPHVELRRRIPLCCTRRPRVRIVPVLES